MRPRWGMSDSMEIVAVSAESAPLHLLALADPVDERVRRYVQDGVVFVGRKKGEAVAVAVVRQNGGVVELMNLAVTESWQGRGLGGQLVAHVLEFARKAGAVRVEVGTGNSSAGPLRFYQRKGFRITGVDRDYFKDCDPPIFEEGIRCLDMIRLSFEIEKV